MFKRISASSDPAAIFRSNSIHFCLDIGWFGILSGSAAGFLGVYLTRLGATNLQIGLLSAAGAVVSLLLAIPAGFWLERRSLDRAVAWTSVGQRAFYLLWIPLPWLLGAQSQIWTMIFFALMMAIPASALGVGFNALFAASIPSESRASLAGLRNIVMSVTFMAASLGSGWILDNVVFPSNYQIVFAIGAVSALLSSFHLAFIRPLPPIGVGSDTSTRITGSIARPETFPARSKGIRSVLRTDVLKTSFGPILLVIFAFSIAQNLALPLFPIYFVRVLELTDSQIGIGVALFYLAHLIGSTQLARVSRRLGHHKVTAIGALATCLYPIILGFTHVPQVFFILQVIGGLVWSFLGGAQANYLLDNIPYDQRPAYLSWVSVVGNASLLIGSLSGPAIANWLGLAPALIFFGVLRFFGGAAILKWGQGKTSHPSPDIQTSS